MAFMASSPNEQLFVRAVETGDLNLLERALQEQEGGVYGHHLGISQALHKAIQFRHWAIADRLLDVPGINLRSTDDYGDTAFLLACKIGNLPLVQKIVSLGINLLQHDRTGQTGLQIACAGNHYEVAQYLLVDCKCDPNWTSGDGSWWDGWTAIHYAFTHELVTLLLDHGANIHATCEAYLGGHGTTPLLIAAAAAAATCRPSSSIIQLLLDRGARIHDKNSLGQNALHLVAEQNEDYLDGSIVPVLINHDVDLSARDHQGKTPFDSAHSKGNTNMCNLFLDSFRVRLVEKYGDLALHVILRQLVGLRFRTEIGKLTMEHFTTLTRPLNTLRVRDEHGMLPLHIAAEKGAPVQVLELLMFHNACRVPDHTGALPIHHACKASAPMEVIRYFGDTGGVDTIRKRDLQGRLPLHALFQNLNGPTPEVVNYLLKEYEEESLSIQTTTGDFAWTLVGASSSLDLINYIVRQCPHVVKLGPPSPSDLGVALSIMRRHFELPANESQEMMQKVEELRLHFSK